MTDSNAKPVTVLRDRSCRPNPAACTPAEARQLLTQLSDGWQIDSVRQTLCREYRFADYYQTMAFANAIAYIAHRQDHHPDLWIGYNQLRVCYTTHSAGALSESDFICAAHIDALRHGEQPV